MRIYLDTCCYNRPYDDQAQPRIRLEAEAFFALLALVRHGDAELVVSDILGHELSQTPDPERRFETLGFTKLATSRVLLDDVAAEELVHLRALGFGRMDAGHVGCAIIAKCDVLFTVDDVALRVAERNATLIPLSVKNPAAWLLSRGKGVSG